jgi:choline-sulfatase
VFSLYPEKAAELEAELKRICSPELENEKAHQFQEMQLSMLEEGRVE